MKESHKKALTCHQMSAFHYFVEVSPSIRVCGMQ